MRYPIPFIPSSPQGPKPPRGPRFPIPTPPPYPCKPIPGRGIPRGSWSGAGFTNPIMGRGEGIGKGSSKGGSKGRGRGKGRSTFLDLPSPPRDGAALIQGSQREQNTSPSSPNTPTSAPPPGLDPGNTSWGSDLDTTDSEESVPPTPLTDPYNNPTLLKAVSHFWLARSQVRWHWLQGLQSSAQSTGQQNKRNLQKLTWTLVL